MTDPEPARRRPGFAIPPSYAAGPPPARAFGAARALVAVVWISANLVLLAVAAVAAYLVTVTVLIEGAEFRWREWLAGMGPRIAGTLLGAGALALILRPLNALVLGRVYHPETPRAPRVLSTALIAVATLGAVVGALQSLFIHVAYGL